MLGGFLNMGVYVLQGGTSTPYVGTVTLAYVDTFR